MKARLALVAGGLLAHAAHASTAFAAAPPDVHPEPADGSAGPAKTEPAPRPPKRALPDYGNRGPRPTTAGDVALTTVRVIVSPLYFVSEYVVRRPLEVAIPAAERSNVPKTLYDFFLFGPDHKAGVVPTFLADFGLRPSVGLYGFWDDAFVPKHDLIVHGSTWGSDWLAGGITDRVRFEKGSPDNESLTLTAVTRPDHPYYGIGPRSLQSSESRYGALKVELTETLDKHASRFVALHAGVGLRAVDFHDGDHIDGDPTLAQSIASGALPPPPGYSNDYTLFASQLRLIVDSRGTKEMTGNDKETSGTGVRLQVGGEHDGDLRDGARAGWVKYGGALTGAVDLDAHHRVLSLTAFALFVDPMSHGVVVPFTELASLGGLQPMRAYLAGRMIDRSAFVTTLEYRWPVWAVLDGSIRAELGNVFDAHLNDFAVNLLRFSGSIGLETSAASDNPLQILFGVGSETFAQGGQIDSFRFFVGTTTNGL